MGVDASIALGVRPLQIDSPFNALSGALGLQNAVRQNQLGGLQLEQQKADMADNAALRTALGQGLDLNTPEGQAALYKAAPLKAAGVLKGQQDLQHVAAQTEQAKAAAKKSEQETLTSTVDLYHRQLGGINDYQSAVDFVKRGAMNPVMGKLLGGMQGAMAEIAKIPTDPDGLKKWVEQQSQAALTVKDRITNQTQVRGQDLTAATSTTNNAATNSAHLQGIRIQQAGENGRQATRMSQESAVGGAEGFSPAAIDNAAARYNLDGTLPPMGMGKAGSQGRQAILNRAAELAGGASGTDQRAGQLDNKATAAALTKVSAQKNMVASFEKTANANADLALGLSDRVDRTNINIFNRWLQSGRTGTGSVEAAQFNAANQTFMNEYAKIMSGSMGNTAVSDAARKHAEEMISTAQSKDQYAGVMRTLKTEMGNRMKGFEDQETELRTKLRTTVQPYSGNVPGGTMPPPDGKPQTTNQGARSTIDAGSTGKSVKWADLK